jgi:membrane protein XagC
MTRALDATPVALAGFVAALMLASLTIGAGLIPNDTISLWAGAIVAGDGKLSIGHVVAAYPTLPFLASATLEWITHGVAPAPMLLAACLVGLLAGWWFVSFRAKGLPLIAAAAATALLIFHPALLRAAMAGPSEMLVAVFLFMFGNALFDLRARGAAPEVMIVALSLMGLAFSHPMGAAIACAAVPYLVFAVRPALVANSALNVVLTLIFPTVFSVGAFTYISWVFPGNGWSFYSAPSQSLTAWATGVADLFGGGFTGIHAIDAGFAFALALVLGAPLSLIVAYHVRRRAPLIAPTLVLAATSVTAAAISVATGWFGDPAAVAVIAPVLCAILIVRIPFAREDLGRLIGLLLLGWIGGVLALGLVDPRAVAQFGGAAAQADVERVAALNIGRATIGRSGVLVDTDNAPALVIGRGDARGLLPPTAEQFDLALLFGRLDAPFVAVPDPASATGATDRIDRNFPTLYRHGAPGYRLIFENAIWRLYGRK